jgi:DNA-binding LacI/PurR family transcriptional regulator
MDPAPAQAAMAALLADSPPEAIFAVTDTLAMAAMAALAQAGLSVPGDVGLIGADDLAFAAYPGLRLTTIAQPLDAIAESAVALTVARLDQPDSAPGSVILPATLIERATLRPLPARG